MLERLFSRPPRRHAAGRTDAGVHAVGLGVSFPAPDNWTSRTLHRALNALVPRDCWVARWTRCVRGSTRGRAHQSRRYRYDIGPTPLRPRRSAGHSSGRSAGRSTSRRSGAAAALLQGEHDFQAFAAQGEPKPHYRCRLAIAEWAERPEGRGTSFHVEADRFLHHMVRMLVGTMVDIGARPPPRG